MIQSSNKYNLMSIAKEYFVFSQPNVASPLLKRSSCVVVTVYFF